MEQIQLNLGCGKNKLDEYVNIDIRQSVQPDICCDIEEGLPYETESVDTVLAEDFLEHISRSKVIFVIEEIWRVLKVGGIFRFFTPSTDGRGAFQDPTHRSYWNFNSWSYFSGDEWREMIGTKAKFEIIDLRDILTSNENRIIHTLGILKKVKVEQ